MTSARRQRTTCRRPGRYRHRRRTAVVVVVFVVVAAVVLPSPRAVALASLWFLPLLSSVFAVVAAVINYMSPCCLAFVARTLGHLFSWLKAYDHIPFCLYLFMFLTFDCRRRRRLRRRRRAAFASCRRSRVVVVSAAAVVGLRRCRCRH